VSLHNLRREKTNDSGQPNWLLYDPVGVVITVFSQFCRTLSGLSFATRSRYVIVISRFLDFLYEVKVLGSGVVTRAEANRYIDQYLQLLRSGDKFSLSQGKPGNKTYAPCDEIREAHLRSVARKLGISPLSEKSWSNTIAALNRFLKVCSILEREAKEMARLKGCLGLTIIRESPHDYAALINAVEMTKRFSAAEVLHIKQSSMLGAVTRFRGTDLTRPIGLQQSSRQRHGLNTSNLAFPEEGFKSLLEKATSWRDRARWTLQYGTSIRRSEALNCLWCDIDFKNREVYVLDPNERRYGRAINEEERKRRFKGRIVSWTYFRWPYRDWFFDFIEHYRSNEYRLPKDGNSHVFQYLIYPHYGRPLVEASDQTLTSTFTSAIKRAGILGPAAYPEYVWTEHNLRHGCIDFMKNDFKLPGQDTPAFTDAELQFITGHKSIQSVKQYAREREADVQAKLLRYDLSQAQGSALKHELKEPWRSKTKE
jgi:integrase